MRTLTIGLALTALLCAGAQAASISTTATLNGTATLGGTAAVSATGSGTLTNIGAVTFTATASLGTTAITGPITITVTSGGTLTGTISLPLSILTGGSSNSSAAVVITGGTGTLAGSTGTLSGNGTGSVGVSGITFTFTGSGTINTSGGGTTAPIPTITAVLDAASYTSSIAQGSIFVVKGTNLSASGFASASYPLLTTYNNVKITFTPAAGGSGTDCPMIYTYNQTGVNQLAAELPGTLAVGNYNVTVNNNGTTGPTFAASVVARKPGAITRDSTGSGLAVVQNYVSAGQVDIDAYTTQTFGGVTLSPAKPGQTLITYWTGLGNAPGSPDNNASPGYNFLTNGVTVTANVGGTTITPTYAGRAPNFVGLDQVNIALPANVPTGCAVSFQLTIGGVTSSTTYLSIAPDANSGACVQPGYTTAQLSQFDQGQNYTTGVFDLSQYGITVPSFGSIKYDSFGGGFLQYSGFQLAAISSSASVTTVQSGACTVNQVTSTGSAVGASSSTYLDAGTLSATGPTGSNITNAPMTFSATTGYSLRSGAEGSSSIPGFPAVNFTVVPGTYSITGPGGKDVGKFSTSVSLGSPLTVTGGLPTTVTRSSGLTVSFTGGNASDIVELTGGSTSGSGTNTTSVSFYCLSTAGAGSIVVSPTILNLLPASASLVPGSLTILSGPVTTFTAPLTAGGSVNADFIAFLGTSSSSVTYK